MRSQLNSIRFLSGLFLLLFAISGVATAAVTPRTQVDEIRHQIVMSPYYSVFDWIEANVLPDKTVVLSGQVRNPYAKPDAEYRIRKIEGVTRVVNQLEVLPVSISDDRIRLEMYRALFRSDSPLSRYAHPLVPSIHIVVDNGRVTLKGTVSDKMDRQLAGVSAHDVPGVFEIHNDLTL